MNYKSGSTVKLSLLLLFCLVLASCESLHFYGQAIKGQLSILGKREKIQTLIDDSETDVALKQQLESILRIRDFAESTLDLPVENNYSTYVNLERPFVVWNVFAADEFSMTPQNWCYPIAGCVSYRGYFSETAARAFANKLVEDDLDVYVGGVAAYSTLGWFADPVLNTIINREEHRLAALIFHELAHQLVYLPGETEFNESFATAIELEGLKRWLSMSADTDLAASLVAQATLEQEYRRAFVNLVESYIPLLEALYSSAVSVNDKRSEKEKLIEKMRADYQILKQSWQGFAGYDAWFTGEINNAKLNTVATYFNLVPAFEVLMAEVDYQLPEFYKRVRELADLKDEERQAALMQLTTNL